MKSKLLAIICVMTSLFVAANRDQKKIEKLVKPYEHAIEFMSNLDINRKVSDQDVFTFFTENDLYKKKDIRKFKIIVRTIKKMIYSKKSLLANRDHFEKMITNLDAAQDFITNYAKRHSALLTYYEIAEYYFYIDEQQKNLVDLIVRNHGKFHLPDMEYGRGLYKFVKKIDLDLRRLTALFVQNDLSDDIVIKINHIKIKLGLLKHKISVHQLYKSQHRKTRFFKAFGVCLILGVSGIATIVSIAGGGVWAPWVIILFPLLFTQICITMHELNESSKYNIPVENTSLFSFFTPCFFPLTWIPQG